MRGTVESRGCDRAPRTRREINSVEVIAVLTVIAAVLAMAIWFLFFSSGGIGPGTV
jgi:hypothetical protein